MFGYELVDQRERRWSRNNAQHFVGYDLHSLSFSLICLFENECASPGGEARA